MERTCTNCQFCNNKHWCDYGFEHLHISPEMAKTYHCDHWREKEDDLHNN